MRFRITFLLLALIPLTGCARQVLREADRGVVAIPTNSNIWPFKFRDRADNLMAEHFPNGYVIEGEQEAVIGTTTQFEENEKGPRLDVLGGLFSIGSGDREGTTTTSDKTEYRISYRSADFANHRY